MRARTVLRNFRLATLALGVALAPSKSVAEARAAGFEQEAKKYCANIAASVEATRLAKNQKLLSEMEAQLGARIAALEAKQNEVRTILEQLESFERKTNDALVAFYSRMKPDAAAAQLAQLDDDAAAALLLRLKAKVSSAILNEMEAARGAALAKRISQQRPLPDGKRP